MSVQYHRDLLAHCVLIYPLIVEFIRRHNIGIVEDLHAVLGFKISKTDAVVLVAAASIFFVLVLVLSGVLFELISLADSNRLHPHKYQCLL